MLVNMAESSDKVLSEGLSFSTNLPTDYIMPMDDPYNKAISYLEKHNILQLFQNLTTEVIYHKPTDPLEYLIQEVQQLQQQQHDNQEVKSQK